MTKLGFTQSVHRPHGWAKRGLCLFWLCLLIVLAAGPLHAQTLHECDFESGICGSIWADYMGQGTWPGELNTFSNFGITPLTGGGQSCVAMKCDTAKPESATRLLCDYTPSPEVYIRFYIYFPTGYIANTNFAVSLKLLRPTWPVSSEDADIKLGTEDGKLKLKQEAFYKPYTGSAYRSSAFPANGFGLNTWHYVEAHYKHNTGNDVMQIWVDADSRTKPPTWSETGIDVFDYDLSRCNLNINWSNNPPATQQYYIDGLRVDNVPVGDTCELLVPPAPPTGVSLSAP